MRRLTLQRPAFTLVELLVVIAIIGVLVSLLLPAVQSAREAARRVACSNHLKQLSLAVQLYHDQHGEIPSLYNGQQDPGAGFFYGLQSFSWRTIILPFLEQHPLRDQFDFTQYATHSLNQPAAGTVVEDFLCPSTPRPERSNHPSPRNLVAGLYVEKGRLDEELQAAVTDYAAAEGLIEGGLCIGGPWGEVLPPSEPFGPRVMQTLRFDDVRDGLSNTIQLLEKAGLPDRYFGSALPPELHDPPELSTWGNVGLWALSGEERLNHLEAQDGVPIIGGDNLRGAYSFHPGGAQSAFADGSVRFLADSLASEELFELVTRDGGEAGW